MAFRLRQQTEDWFKYIFKKDGPVSTKFDIFYLCLMVGIAVGRSDKPTDAPEIVNHFIEDYKGMQRIIIALLLITEMKNLGSDLSDRKVLQKLMDQYVDPSSPANLTDTGFARMNEYASGGFDYLAEQFPDKPHHVEDFLQIYARIMQEAVSKNDAWKAMELTQ